MPEEIETVKQQQRLLPIAEAIHECERELQVRQRCYSRWVSEGKLTAFEASERRNRLASAIGWLARFQAEAETAATKMLDTSDYQPA